MVNVAILGFGIVGSGVAQVLRENAAVIASKTGEDVALKYILDLRTFEGTEWAGVVTSDIGVILSDPSVTVVIETMGGSEPAYSYTKAALQSGRSVVTSNKEVVANFGAELLQIANDNGVNYMFEASVGGGIPIIRPLHQCLAANEIGRVTGILNGTTNYILTKMSREKQSFEQALADAQQKGYAERNPSADVDGLDTCRKICILSSLAFGRQVPPSRVYTKGIRSVGAADIENASKAGYAVKLLGSAERCGEELSISTEPFLVGLGNPLSNVEDVYNGIQVVGNAIGDVMFYGRGAGKLPTASAVVADVIDCVKHVRRGISWEKSDGAFVSDRGQETAAFYVRLKSSDDARHFDIASEIPAVLETAFITHPLNIAAHEKIVEGLGDRVLSSIRVLES